MPQLRLGDMPAHPWRTAMEVAVGLLCGALIAALAPTEVLFLGLLAGVTLGSYFEPLVGVIAGLACGPLRAWLALFAPQIPDQVGQLFFLLGVAGWLVRGLVRRELHLTRVPLLAPLLLFLGAGLLSLWSPFDAWAGFTEWAKWVQVTLALWIVGARLQEVDAHRCVVALLAAFGAVGVGEAALGIWQHSLAGEGPLHFLITPGVYRAYGTFMQPNPFGGFLGLLAAIFVGLALGEGWQAVTAKRLPARWFWPAAGTALIMVGGLYGSWSRGAWMGFGAALALMAVWLPRRSGWGIALLVVIVLAGGLLAAAEALPAAVVARLTDFLAYVRFEDVRGVGVNDANYAVMERMAHWQAALGMWESHFWTGVGIGNYEAAYPQFRLVNWPYALGHAHNIYLNLLAETGVIGLGAYLVFAAAIYARLWQATRRLIGWPRGLAVGLAGAWTQLHVHNLVDNLYVNNVHLYAGVLLALTAWLTYLTLDRARAGALS